MSTSKFSKFTLLLLISAIFVSVVSVPINSSEKVNTNLNINSSNGLNRTEPIIITDNSVLDAYSINGSGTLEDPHIFEDYVFEFNVNDIALLVTENVTEYFIIRNCSIINNQTEAKGIGIKLMSEVGIIDNCTITNTLDGIHLGGNNHHVNNTIIEAEQFGIWAKDESNLTITDTVITSAKYGISLHYCDNILIQYNYFSSGIIGIQLNSCKNFEIRNNLIGGYSIGLWIVESPPKSGSVNKVVYNAFSQNELHAQLISIDANTRFYDETTETGNLWDDWRGWGKYSTDSGVIDLYPMELIQGLDPTDLDLRDLELGLAPKLPFKFWFWIFAPTLVVLGLIAYFIYWKLILQPKNQ